MQYNWWNCLLVACYPEKSKLHTNQKSNGLAVCGRDANTITVSHNTNNKDENNNPSSIKLTITTTKQQERSKHDLIIRTYLAVHLQNKTFLRGKKRKTYVHILSHRWSSPGSVLCDRNMNNPQASVDISSDSRHYCRHKDYWRGLQSSLVGEGTLWEGSKSVIAKMIFFW